MRVTLQPNETRTIEKAGYSVYLLDAPGEVEVTIDNESEALQAGQGIPSNGVMFEGVRLVNLESVEQTIDLHIASNNRGIISNRMSGAVDTQEQAANGYQGLPKITVVAAGTVQIPGNLNRKKIQISADALNTARVWVGATAVDVGQPLEAGDVIDERVSGAIDLYFEGAGTVYLSEVV